MPKVAAMVRTRALRAATSIALCSLFMLAPRALHAQVTKTLDYNGGVTSTLSDSAGYSTTNLSLALSGTSECTLTADLSGDISLEATSLTLGAASGSQFLLVQNYITATVGIPFRTAFGAWMNANGFGLLVNSLPSGTTNIKVIDNQRFDSSDMIALDSYLLDAPTDIEATNPSVAYERSASLKSAILTRFPSEIQPIVSNALSVTASATVGATANGSMTVDRLDGPNLTDFTEEGQSLTVFVSDTLGYPGTFTPDCRSSLATSITVSMNLSISLAGAGATTLGSGTVSLGLADSASDLPTNIGSDSVAYSPAVLSYTGPEVCDGKISQNFQNMEGFSQSYDMVYTNTGETDYLGADTLTFTLTNNDNGFVTFEPPVFPADGILHPGESMTGTLTVESEERNFNTGAFLSVDAPRFSCDLRVYIGLFTPDLEYRIGGNLVGNVVSRNLVGVPAQTSVLRIDLKALSNVSFPVSPPVAIDSSEPGLWSVVPPSGNSILTGQTDYFEVRFTPESGTTVSTATYTLASNDFDGNFLITVTGTNLVPEGEPEGELPAVHSADTTPDQVIALVELLRVIQLFNAGALHCAATPDATEDGFEPGIDEARESCVPHSSDYGPQDWTIGLTELLRLIQYYNLGGYTYCGEGEDGYCPAAP
ncbi:MAG: hypothetical protein GC168_07405 [Candidatus Hydrogenedens sp.]|nr:hypothetical protein [Candidatus Hydrogenedens sp.]